MTVIFWVTSLNPDYESSFMLIFVIFCSEFSSSYEFFKMFSFFYSNILLRQSVS